MSQQDSGTPEPTPGPGAPEVSRVFDELRTRPERKLNRLQRRMERKAASRLPPPRREGWQRGDLAEPPPVLDVEVERPEDRERVRRALVLRCGTHPVWEIAPDHTPADGGSSPDGPERAADPRGVHGRDTVRPPRRGRLRRRPRDRAATQPRPPQSAPGPSASAEPPHATTDELYRLLEELVEEGFAWPEAPRRKRGRKVPPPPRFAHLRSLLWLYRSDYAAVEGNAKGKESSGSRDDGQAVAAGGDPEQWQESRTHAEVVGRLRAVRLNHAKRRLEQADSELKKARREGGTEQIRAAARARRRAARVVARRNLVKRASPLLDLLGWLGVRAKFDKLDDAVFTPVGYGSSVLTSVPVGFVVAGAAAFDNAVVLGGAVLLALGFLGLLLCIRRPWLPYAWLNHHRYMDWAPSKDQNAADDHRSRGTHVLSRLSTDREREGEIREGSGPPAVHRLAVNAFLDDLHHAYGVSGRRYPWPLRGRDRRPVLVFDADGADRVTAYFVQLIEDERLRRAYPDPLVLVQVRGRGTTSVVEEAPEPARYTTLPEAVGHEPEVPSLRAWVRARQSAGVLGSTRLLRVSAGPFPEEAVGDATAPTRVLTAPALTGLWGAGAGALALVVLVALPPVVQQTFECVDEGLLVPEGITTVADGDSKACVGLTYGDFVFDDRLEEVSQRIERQNTRVDDSGAPYVTIAYLGELDTPGHDTYNMAGVQGELVGMAMRQAQHNEFAGRNGAKGLRIKLLIGNAGRSWEHGPDVADQIVERAEDESLGMDRPIVALGFGQSVAPNSEAIQHMSTARIPVIGTTATFDDVAAGGPGQPRSPYFFPTAPSNSRLAAQAANWALEGASTVRHGRQLTLEPAGNAAVIANARAAGDGGDLEQYGPDLAQRFMEGFEAGGGRPWSPPEGRDLPGDQGGGILFYDETGTGDLPTVRDQIEEVCKEDPPDLFYYAGRSEEFGEFLSVVEGGGTSACRRGETTVLAADDISKYAADEEQNLAERSPPQIFYTPLVPSAPWEDTAAEAHATTFYVDVQELIEDLYDEDEDEKLPSVAHAATAYDAMRVIDRSLDQNLVGGAPSRFLADEEHYEETRETVYTVISGTSGISGNSGYLGLEDLGPGNWNPHRLVQLVFVGEEIGGEFQHVVESCGMTASDEMLEDAGCIDTGASDHDREP